MQNYSIQAQVAARWFAAQRESHAPDCVSRSSSGVLYDSCNCKVGGKMRVFPEIIEVETVRQVLRELNYTEEQISQFNDKLAEVVERDFEEE